MYLARACSALLLVLIKYKNKTFEVDVHEMDYVA